MQHRHPNPAPPIFHHRRREPSRALRWTAWVLLPVLIAWSFGPSAILIAQPVQVPNLNAPAFNSGDLAPQFDEASGAFDQAAWFSIVQQGKTVLTARWEATVDASINRMPLRLSVMGICGRPKLDWG